jgi:hypothetical protein
MTLHVSTGETLKDFQSHTLSASLIQHGASRKARLNMCFLSVDRNYCIFQLLKSLFLETDFLLKSE